MTVAEERAFSKRFGYRRPSGQLVRETAPKEIRTGLVWVISRVSKIVAVALFPNAWGAGGSLTLTFSYLAGLLDEHYRCNLSFEELEMAVDGCPWHEYYDICEYTYAAFGKMGARVSHHTLGAEFEDQLNRLFEDYEIGYRMRSGLVEHYGSAQTEHAIASARRLLGQPEFRGPDEQFEKAIAFLSQRPKPDAPNCAKEAVLAIEGVARIISGDVKATLGALLDREPLKSGIHPTVRFAIDKVYGYSSDVGGVRHGQVGPSEVGVREAEWVLTVSAATILFLVNKFGAAKKN